MKQTFLLSSISMSKSLLNARECAEILDVTRQGFIKMIDRGDIKPELVVGRQKFFARRAVKALERKRNGRKK